MNSFHDNFNGDHHIYIQCDVHVGAGQGPCRKDAGVLGVGGQRRADRRGRAMALDVAADQPISFSPCLGGRGSCYWASRAGHQARADCEGSEAALSIKT